MYCKVPFILNIPWPLLSLQHDAGDIEGGVKSEANMGRIVPGGHMAHEGRAAGVTRCEVPVLSSSVLFMAGLCYTFSCKLKFATYMAMAT